MLGLQLFFVLNIFIALYPLFRPKDDLADIPLTPTQRSLLGLNPSATTNSATPGTQFVTPPKYRVSSRTGSPVGRSASPLSTSANFSSQKASSGPSFSPTTSPLLYKAVSNGGKESTRRPSFGSSYGSSSPLGRSTSSFKESSFGPATPSPIGGKRVNVGLSNKWLYERSRRLSTSNGGL